MSYGRSWNSTSRVVPVHVSIPACSLSSSGDEGMQVMDLVIESILERFCDGLIVCATDYSP